LCVEANNLVQNPQHLDHLVDVKPAVIQSPEERLRMSRATAIEEYEV
jgi:hypothetical protein